MKVARRYEEGVKLHQAYIDVLLRLAGYRLSDLYTSILASIAEDILGIEVPTKFNELLCLTNLI